MSCILGIDLGTSYFKAVLFGREGNVLGLGRYPVPKQTNGARCELQVEEFWRVLHRCVAAACTEARVSAADIAAVGYASQANSFLLLDGAAQPLTPLILWPDLRTEAQPRVRELWEHPDFLQTTGLGLGSPEFMAHKLCWIQREEPALWAKARHVMTISDYFVYGLTGSPAGDEGTAALLGLWDLPRHRWWDAALAQVAVPQEFLSSPAAPGAVVGRIRPAASGDLGIRPGTPLIAGSLDHHMAALGAGLGAVAPATDSTGTVIALLRELPRWEPRTGCCMGPAAGGDGFYQLAFSTNGAGAIESYQREQAPDLSIPELLAMAQTGQAPHGAPVRKLLEDAAAEVDALVQQLYPGEAPERIVATGGGARSDVWLQLKADRVGAEFLVTRCQEPACLGAALLASVGIGWFSDVASASASWVHPFKSFLPRQQLHAQPQELCAPSVLGH